VDSGGTAGKGGSTGTGAAAGAGGSAGTGSGGTTATGGTGTGGNAGNAGSGSGGSSGTAGGAGKGGAAGASGAGAGGNGATTPDGSAGSGARATGGTSGAGGSAGKAGGPGTDAGADTGGGPVDSGNATCALKGMPAGKVLQGYWEAWDGAKNGVHPPYGHVPITSPTIPAAYNVINTAFPVIQSDGTAQWFDGMDVDVDVPTPAEMCEAKTQGRTILMSIGGATAAVDLGQTATVDRFIATVVPILKSHNFDGIDIDIETGLTAGTSMTSLSTSQTNLIRLIDGVIAQMPANFGLTMAPETAYVTGGQIASGGPWGAYLPIIAKYRDNGRLWWLNMQYYNGSMYGCDPPGVGFMAGTVEGFVQQTQCLNKGMTVAGGGTFALPYSKQVPGLPAQPGAGGGAMSAADVVTAVGQVNGIKGLMTWSINWDGSKDFSFATNAKKALGL
ncbi:MAG TPA: glycosyl hydrolase family 18 protein, partial [Polyangiaceae bacterium]|nr:glycosyl hydrolase family 18 protein [Polyangiaceae bacterium]